MTRAAFLKKPRTTKPPGRRESPRSMWPVAVVMLGTDVEDPRQMLVIQDQQPFETL